MTAQCPVPCFQDERELQELLALYQALRPERVLEIGSLYGGTLWHWLRYAPQALVVSVDQIVGEGDPRQPHVLAARGFWQSWVTPPGELVTIEGDSTANDVVNQVHEWGQGPLGEYDFVFVDGDHSYPAVRRDFLNYWPMVRAGGLLAFHDISCPDENPDRIEVGRFWRELVASGRYSTRGIQMAAPGTWGIGVVFA